MKHMAQLNLIEPNFEAFLHANLKPNTVFVDVGANVGKYTKLAVGVIEPDKGGQIHAFEPHTQWARAIVGMVERGNHTHTPGLAAVQVHCIALGASLGLDSFYLARGNASTSSSTHLSINGDNLAARRVSVATMPLDSIITAFDILKVDTEGAESSVLQGSRRLLQGGHPMAVLVECHPHKGTPTSNTLDLLESCGFKREWMRNENWQTPREDGTKEHIIAVNTPNFFTMPLTGGKF